MTSTPTLRTLPKHAARLDRLPPYGFAIIGQRLTEMKAAGLDVIRLDIGSPDMPPPQMVIEALKRSADNPKHHSYGSYRGDPGFRKAVAGYYRRRFGVELDPDTEVLPLIGSKEGLINLALAYLDTGDAALIPDINYPAYSMGALMAGGTVLNLPLDPDQGYRPRFDLIRGDLSRATLLWVNYPNNPTGATADLALYAEIVDFCRAHHLLLCSDNPYAEVVFDGYRAPSALQVPGAKDLAVEFMSLSKMYNMAGWRLGACVGNREAIDNLLVIKSNMDSGHFKAVYDAGAVALNETPDLWIDERNAVYQARRDKIAAVLPQIGLHAAKPRGSLYFWAKVAGGDDQRYTEDALTGALVALTPGTMYGEAGRGYVRVSLGVDDQRLDDALDRLKSWYNGR
jgi:LL-diaminopimelate aminotransferase